MDFFQAGLLALVQGITELFPISSLGHAVILPALLGWSIDQSSPGFLPFLVVMHLGTAVALLLYFARDWWSFGQAILVKSSPNARAERAIFGKVMIATVPAAVLGALFEHALRAGFAAPRTAAAILVLNGLLLFAADRQKPIVSRDLASLRWHHALAIGFCQCLALIPGFSRSGMTMAGGYLVGLNHEDAARFSFLTATPIIVGAAVLEVPKLLKQGGHFSSVALFAGIVAGICAWISAAVLMRWFRQHEPEAFRPFAFYCMAAGSIALVLLLAR